MTNAPSCGQISARTCGQIWGRVYHHPSLRSDTIGAEVTGWTSIPSDGNSRSAKREGLARSKSNQMKRRHGHVGGEWKELIFGHRETTGSPGISWWVLEGDSTKIYRGGAKDRKEYGFSNTRINSGVSHSRTSILKKDQHSGEGTDRQKSLPLDNESGGISFGEA